VKDAGEPCAGEPHARFDGRGLETEHYCVTAPVPDPTTLPSSFTPSRFPRASGLRCPKCTCFPSAASAGRWLCSTVSHTALIAKAYALQVLELVEQATPATPETILTLSIMADAMGVTLEDLANEADTDLDRLSRQGVSRLARVAGERMAAAHG
jgi:hypothetical protein